ncbi:hypothetical protein U2F26_07795 [Micromonospora sp. 4G57]|uniref:Uncharacterized protein n=1 Tax=Micromonospora sicca TaxID=2202420 RepID=A0ABU5J877_9ACTN|nr:MULTISPECIES: hypothetical protein [unclassified Micromonospora]MDZ5442632.1 hypothetical protein [Micromonospora sp. 4G57]MDZ5488787.1 hypothetical protein [Micromonospora sp. 4G53]
MTDHGPTPESPRHPDPPSHPDPWTAPADGLGTIPDWLRHPQFDAEPSRADRRRIWLSRHSVKLLGGAAALLLLTFFGLVGTTGYRALQRWGEPPAAHPTISLPTGEQASSSASPPSAAGPFDGTPAAAFPEGAAGIALPAAKPTGPFSKKQVAAALAKVRTALVTARLDRRFATTKDPEPFIRQFAPDARADLRKDFASDVFATYATKLTPGARMTGDQLRAKGRISYRATKDAGGIRILEVTTNFVWAYAFRTSGTVPGDGVVVVHDTVVWSVPHPDDVDRSSNGLWIEEANSFASNIDCAAFDKGLLDLGTPSFGGPDDPDPDAVFDPDKTLDLPDTC